MKTAPTPAERADHVAQLYRRQRIRKQIRQAGSDLLTAAAAVAIFASLLHIVAR